VVVHAAMVVIGMTMVVVLSGGKGWDGKHRQQQGCGKNLFHRQNRSMIPMAGVRAPLPCIKMGNGTMLGSGCRGDGCAARLILLRHGAKISVNWEVR
jgi:hypothetical protein